MHKFLIAGNGRLSRHLQKYFSFLNIPFQVWSRQHKDSFDSLVPHFDRILLAIKDDTIAPFVSAHPVLQTKICVHFSGSVHCAGAYSVHPLMTFGTEDYDRATYEQIPFVTVKGEPHLSELLPGLPNPTYAIEAEDKPLYHAFCVMSGNFTTLLWSSIFKDFTRTFGLPREVLYPFLQQTVRNTLKDPERALTGPLVRGDVATITSHLETLKGTTYEKLYLAFLNLVSQPPSNPVEKYEHPSIQ